MAESEEKLNSLLMKVKVESEKVGLKLNIQKMKIMASGPIIALMFSFPNLEPVCCSMSGSDCCPLTCIQVSQEAGKMFCYSHLLRNFPQFIVIHTVKGFGIVNKAEVDVFLELSCFFL